MGISRNFFPSNFRPCLFTNVMVKKLQTIERDSCLFQKSRRLIFQRLPPKTCAPDEKSRALQLLAGEFFLFADNVLHPRHSFEDEVNVVTDPCVAKRLDTISAAIFRGRISMPKIFSAKQESHKWREEHCTSIPLRTFCTRTTRRREKALRYGAVAK
ncbi:hypothetical protein BDR22DRAFT_857678 [Usnea florida]